MADPLIFFGCGCLAVGVILDIISIATRDWMTYPNGNRSGLWTNCTVAGACVPINITDILEGVRAMMVLSVLVSGFALVVVVVYIAYARMKNVSRNWVTIFAAVLTFLAVVQDLIGILIYHRHIWTEAVELDTHLRHGYSFWLGVATIVLFFLAGIFLLASAIVVDLSRRKKLKDDSASTVVYYNTKSEAPKKYVYSSWKFSGDLKNDVHGHGPYPINYDNMYYNTVPMPLGIYGYISPRIDNPVPRDGPDFRIPRDGPDFRIPRDGPDFRIPRESISNPPVVYIA